MTNRKSYSKNVSALFNVIKEILKTKRPNLFSPIFFYLVIVFNSDFSVTGQTMLRYFLESRHFGNGEINVGEKKQTLYSKKIPSFFFFF